MVFHIARTRRSSSCLHLLVIIVDGSPPHFSFPSHFLFLSLISPTQLFSLYFPSFFLSLSFFPKLLLLLLLYFFNKQTMSLSMTSRARARLFSLFSVLSEFLSEKSCYLVYFSRSLFSCDLFSLRHTRKILFD